MPKPFRYLEPTFFAGLFDDPLLLIRVRPTGRALLFDCGKMHHLAKRVYTSIDAIFISHAHMDHFDIPSLRRLENKRTPVITAWETSDLLRVDRYRKVTELRWDERTRVGPAEIRAFEVNHWGARMRSDTYRGYNGYVIESGSYRFKWVHNFYPVRKSYPLCCLHNEVYK